MSDDASLHLSDPLPFPRQFRSKVDWWLAALMLSPLVVVVAIAASAGVSDPWVAIALAAQGLVLWVLGRTDYSIDQVQLVARSGPFRFTVPVASIRSLSATRNPLSAPALSLDRIAVDHTGGRLLISPRNKAGFVRAVLTVAPGVAVTGLPGATGAATSDPPESSFSVAAVLPAILVGAFGLAFGAWQFYAGTRAPEATIDGHTLSISGLYSATIHRSEVIRITLEDHVDIGRRVNGFDGGRRLRGFFEVSGLGRSRLFVSRDSPPFLVIRTRTQPVVISFDDPSRTRALHADLQRAWGLETGDGRPTTGHRLPLPTTGRDNVGGDGRFLSPGVPLAPEVDLSRGVPYPRMTTA